METNNEERKKAINRVLDLFDFEDPIFGRKLDRDKAVKVIEQFFPHLFRTEAHCSCDDEYCPHKSLVNPLADFLLHEALKKCYTFERTILEVDRHLLENLVPEQLETKNGMVHIGKERLIKHDKTFYTRYFTKIKNGRRVAGSYPIEYVKNDYIIPGYFDIIEGVRTVDERVHNVLYKYNDAPFSFPVEKHGEIYYCPVLLIPALIPYTQLTVLFLDINNNEIIDVDFDLIGGYTSFPIRTLIYKVNYQTDTNMKKYRISNGIISEVYRQE